MKEEAENRALIYVAEICGECGSRDDCDKKELGSCLPTISEYTAFRDGFIAATETLN